jgi:hypothetical protein
MQESNKNIDNHIWGSHIPFYRNKPIFYPVVESNIKYGCELQKVWNIKHKNEELEKKIGLTQTIWEWWQVFC